MTAWCILQTAPAHTIQLAAALVDAGFEAWTPTETVKPDPPKAAEPWDRQRPRPRRKMPDFITRPLFPTFVFVRADRQGELAAMSHAPDLTYLVWDKDLRRMVSRGRPFFRLFHADARPIPDEALDPIRRIEGRRRRKPRGKLPVFKPGDPVRLTEGAYEGLRGVVVRVEGKMTVVRFPGGAHEPKIQTWLLIPDLDDSRKVHQNARQPERRVRFAA